MCPYSKTVWKDLVMGLLLDKYSESWREIMILLKGDDIDKTKTFLLRYTFQNSIHSIWSERNRRRHGEQPSPAEILVKKIDKNVRNRLSTLRWGGDSSGFHAWRCKQATVVTSHVVRRTRCSGCDLEFKYRSIGDGVHVTENDTVRLSDPTNPILSNSGLSIVTTEHKNGFFDDSLSLNLGTSQNSETITASSDEVLRSDLGNLQNKALSIEVISDGLDLPATIKDHANEIFKEVEDYS